MFCLIGMLKERGRMFNIPFQTIVVGVDFSDYSKIVMKQAQKLALLWKAKLVVVHALNEPVDYTPTLYVEVRKSLGPHYYKDKIKTFYKLKSAPFELVVDFSSPERLIRMTAKKFPRSLIVAGYKGHSLLREFLFGSTARRLVLNARTPVWIHRGKYVIEPRRILIPHDLSVQANRSIDLFKKLNLFNPMTYQVYFVREAPFPVLDYTLYKKIEKEQLLENQKRMKSLFAKYPRLSFQTSSGELTEKLVQKTSQFDLILISHRHSSEFYSRSETLQLMRKSPVPLLVI